MSNSQTPEPGTERALRSTVRNPRRRQRQSDADSVKSAPRRKRSKISEDTFVPVTHDEEVNGTIEVPMNGDIQHANHGKGPGRSRKESTPMLEGDMAFRSKRSSLKRPGRSDGATVLTQNSRYSVKMLPSTPRELRRDGIEYRGSLGAAHNALAVTRDRAFIWDYTSHAPVANPRVFDLPFAVKTTDPLPLGALVASSTSTDIGLVLISATTGKIVFYESIERAASLGLFQERNAGVEGLLGSLNAGETVSDLISASHAGFIVTLSSGRIAQLTLRDAQGRPRIFAQFLRAVDQHSSGFFGSIKGILGSGGWNKDVAAVHTRPLGTRGQIQVVSLTARAELQIWDLDGSGRYTFKGTIDFRDVIVQELRKVLSPEMQGQAENITMLDFAIVEKPSSTNEIATLGAEIPLELRIFLRNGISDRCTHVLAEMVIDGENVAINQATELETYHSRTAIQAQSRPRLLLPKPRHTAMIAFEDAIVIAGIHEAHFDSPEAQLHASYIQAAAFEDSVYLQQGIRLLGASEEEAKSSQESAIFFIEGTGLARVSVAEPTDSQPEGRIPIKTRIEQAVFNGTLQDGNVLDFSRVCENLFSPGEVEEAAISISKEILRSTSAFITTPPTSMDAHLTYKAHALRALVSYVRQNYTTLSQSAMWQLLWDAEKVVVGQQMWKAFEDHVAASNKTKRVATVMDEVCALVLQDLGANPEDLPSGDQLVRNFLTHNLHRIDRLLPMACQLLKMIKDSTDKNPQTKMRLVLEADDLWTRALEAVFAFRAKNAASYGILPDFIEEGLLTDAAEYAELPEFWTSTEPMLKAVVHMCELSRVIAEQEWGANETNTAIADVLEPMTKKISAENPRLIQLLCHIYQERISWLASRPSDRDRELAEKLRLNYDSTRYDQFRALAMIAQPEAGMKLAEKYKDMQTLTEIVVGEMQYWIEELHDRTNDENRRTQVIEYMTDLTDRIGRYFDHFGDDWANAYFDEGFSGSKAGVMLRDAQEHWQDALTRYLRAEPSRAKICWINDITSSKDFEHASERLVLAARDQETQLWAKQVELSMAKLAVMATEEGVRASGSEKNRCDVLVTLPDNELEIANTQDLLYQHLLPEIRHCIDKDAELEVAMQKFGFKNQDLHFFRSLLEAYLRRVLKHEVLSVDELIDVLTLMDTVENDGEKDTNLQGSEYFYALKVLNAAAPSMPQDRFETLLQLLWKRCYLCDEWVEINSAEKRSDEETAEVLRQSIPWRTLHYALEEDLLQSADSYIRHLLPSECLGSGCQPADLAYRWPDADILDSVIHDNKIQDEQLQGFVADRRLDEWTEACVDDVKKYAEAVADETAQKLQREREFEEAADADEDEMDGNKANGHVKGSNGIKIEDVDDHGVFGPDQDVDRE